ncbi:Armadillo-like helical domain-containing protein 4, partial [Galemys pyrenaicus]
MDEMEALRETLLQKPRLRKGAAGRRRGGSSERSSAPGRELDLQAQLGPQSRSRGGEVGAEGRGATASGVSVSRVGAGTSSHHPIPSRSRGLMNKQQSEAPSPWRPRQWREPPPLQGPPRGCRARAPQLSSARYSAEGAQVRTGPAPATRATTAADPESGQSWSRSPGSAGSLRERCSPGSATARGAPGVRPAPRRNAVPGAGCARAAPGASGAVRRPPRTRCTLSSSPVSRLRTSERAFVLVELAELAAFDLITGIVNSANQLSSTMSRPSVSHLCLAFCSLLVLNFASQCLAFPMVEGRKLARVHDEEGQSQRMDIDDLENNSITSEYTSQLVVTEDPMLVLMGPSAVPLNKVFSVNKETQPMEAGLMQPGSPGVYTATEPAGEEVFGSSHPERTSPKNQLSKATLTIPVTATVGLNIDEKEEPFSSTHVHPVVEETTDATRGFLEYVNTQLFATESQEGVSLGRSPSSYVNTQEMLTTNPRTEKFEADTEYRTTSFLGAEPTVGTELGSLTPNREMPLQMTADNTQTSATKLWLATPEYTLSVKPETDSLLGAPEVTVSVSTTVPAASALSDEWDDTKLESVNQIKTTKLGYNTETQVGVETSWTAQVTDTRMEGGEPLTEDEEGTQGLPERETHTETALLIVSGRERTSAFTDQSSFTPTSPMEDMKVSVVSLFQNTGDIVESTKESNTTFFSETTVSISEYESEAYQSLENTFKDIITQEMTTAVQEAEATLSAVTEEQQVSTLGAAEENGETDERKEPSSATSDGPGVSQLSRQWEPLATTVSTTAVPLSFQVTPTVEDPVDTVTRPSEEFFTPILGPPMTPPGITEKALSISLGASSEGRTDVPSVSRVNTAASYGLDQLESEEGEDEDEEDEEEEEEDEEEDEDDKDGDSLDESLDGDPELPGFTLPGLTSQEPGLEQGHEAAVEGATYQAPDAIEWQQQNQGLGIGAGPQVSIIDTNDG